MKNMNKLKSSSSSVLAGLLHAVPASELLKTEKKMLLASKISRAIEAKGLTKKRLAILLDKQPSEISKWISGTHNFTIETLFSLENHLDLELVNFY